MNDYQLDHFSVTQQLYLHKIVLSKQKIVIHVCPKHITHAQQEHGNRRTGINIKNKMK